MMAVLGHLWMKSARCFGVGGRNGHRQGCDKRGARNNDRAKAIAHHFQ